jgi:hypothetical protein
MYPMVIVVGVMPGALAVSAGPPDVVAEVAALPVA